MTKAYFGGGCFWCTESVFKLIKGVNKVTPGYAGGHQPNPTYEQVCGGQTGQAEVVQVEFDEKSISYQDLLNVFFATHDPTTPNRQGNDVGSQYRSIILYEDPKQKETAESFMADLNASSPEGKPVVTEVKPLDKFWPAEDYHRDYFEKNPYKPYCLITINPKLKKVKKKFAELIK